MSDHIVICHPGDPCIGVESLEGFTAYLQAIGLISTIYKDRGDGEKYYLAGDRILDFIDIPEEREIFGDYSDRFSKEDHIDSIQSTSFNIYDYGSKIELHGLNANCQYEKITCPNCLVKHDLHIKGYDALGDWHENPAKADWQCDNCSSSFHVYELDWGDALCFARCAIDIWTSIPNQTLLNLLKQKTGGLWTYFFYHI